MFGIKTKLFKLVKETAQALTNSRLSSDTAIRHLMNYFHTDIYGHQANIQQADLGYGWIHYGLIRANKPEKLLCIGSRHGYIPAIMAQACKENNKGHVDFVDPGYGPDDKNHWTGEGF